jgi:hypothetical protein
VDSTSCRQRRLYGSARGLPEGARYDYGINYETGLSDGTILCA